MEFFHYGSHESLRKKVYRRMTYRENIANLLKPLRRIQLVSLILILLGIVLTIVRLNSEGVDCWYGKILALTGVIGEFYCWAKARQIKCPQCGKSLSYLLFDPSYSKTNGVIFLPKGLPSDRHYCAYCKASFDDEMNP